MFKKFYGTKLILQAKNKTKNYVNCSVNSWWMVVHFCNMLHVFLPVRSSKVGSFVVLSYCLGKLE